ncbi:ribonuclease HII [Candidatus Nanohalovita haloferacivicina]|uniref:ribonuclease HII n=1 Tax=Candidatus Nanohalovita haloferacivicina TaxID=2978046 RepID=UPI00325FDBBA|nr:Ribonuclease HII [Candidatus Nanohalobia archaeon BNXNv]
MAKVLGIDEAGRGPVIGSMFVGGFLIEENDIEKIEELGVKDSKKLSEKKRESIRDQLEEYGEAFLKEVTAEEIDELRGVMSLNEIEVKAFTDVIGRTEADKVIVDLPEPNAERFINKLKDQLPDRFGGVEFVAEHGADDTFPVVSAASIVAKSARETHIEELKQKYGYDFASGYPHDSPTTEFLEKYVEEKGELPPETRKSWSTAERILKEASQKGLGDF